MKHSQSVDLAVHALLYMAYKAPNETVMIRDIASRQNISESYLAKIFQSLAKTEIVDSIRGKNGGYRLGQETCEITLGDIVRALDGGTTGTFECSFKTRKCPVHPSNCFLPEIFEQARTRMFDVLDAVTLEDLTTRLDRLDSHQEIAWVGKN